MNSKKFIMTILKIPRSSILKLEDNLTDEESKKEIAENYKLMYQLCQKYIKEGPEEIGYVKKLLEKFEDPKKLTLDECVSMHDLLIEIIWQMAVITIYDTIVED